MSTRAIPPLKDETGERYKLKSRNKKKPISLKSRFKNIGKYSAGILVCILIGGWGGYKLEFGAADTRYKTAKDAYNNMLRTEAIELDRQEAELSRQKKQFEQNLKYIQVFHSTAKSTLQDWRVYYQASKQYQKGIELDLSQSLKKAISLYNQNSTNYVDNNWRIFVAYYHAHLLFAYVDFEYAEHQQSVIDKAISQMRLLEQMLYTNDQLDAKWLNNKDLHSNVALLSAWIYAKDAQLNRQNKDKMNIAIDKLLKISKVALRQTKYREDQTLKAIVAEAIRQGRLELD